MTITVPSWVIPGTYCENLRFLRDKADVRGVELLFFIYDDDTRSLFKRELPELRSYADRFSFSVHLPDRLQAIHEELVESTAAFTRSWVVHPSLPEEAEVLARLLESWRARYGDRFYLENTRKGRLEVLLELLPDAPLCLDTGHLLLEDEAPAVYASAHGSLIREVHLHGLGVSGDGLRLAPIDGRLPDHRAFASEAPWFVDLLPFLRGFGGTVNAEVFSWNEAHTIIEALKTRSLR